MKYLRFVIPAALLSAVFGFILPDYQVTTAGGFTGFLLTVTLGTAFSLVFHGYKLAEPRIIRRFSGKKLRPEHTFYLGLLGMSAVSALLIFGFASFTGLLAVGGWFGVVKAGFCLALVGSALVPSPSVLGSTKHETAAKQEPVKEPVTEPAPAPAVVTEPAVEDTNAPIGVPVNVTPAADTVQKLDGELEKGSGKFGIVSAEQQVDGGEPAANDERK